ncbi:FimV/HubP family polar landmark protein [Vogesella facilis]|uniref:FimV/HubP family polar landmark protein n=1 Tax=Vogesella facilis TaxID=1655232 RepID=A0ABV7RH17_9NEIS
MSSLLLALLFSTSAWAGLGGVAVRSNLGEVLRAEIDLTGKADEDVLRVGLAPIETFRDLQVDYTGVLSSLRFTLAYRSNGRPYIRVSSNQPISEPFLRFVVEAKATNARYVREYTILLDPAEYAGRADEISRSNVQAAPLRRPPPPVVRPRPLPADDLPVPPVYRAPRGSLVVQPGQTLSGLARGLGLSGVGQRRVMAALVNANPSAFINGNPSSIKAGSRLKVPSAASMRALPEQQVAQILAGGMAAAHVPAVKPQPAAPAVAPLPEKSVAPAPAPAPAPAAKAAASAPVTLAPSGSPVLKLEAPDAAASAPLNDQALQQAQRKIDELEKQLKALQAAASAAKAAPPAAAEPAQESGPSMMDSLLDNLPLVAGGSAAVLLLSAAVVFLRRRRGNDAVTSAATINVPLDNVGRTLAAGAAASDSAFLADFTRTSMNTVDTVEVDPVAEAEVYLAYGRDQQAEEILRDALAKDPTRHEARLKLMEIYVSRQDRSALEGHAKELHAVTGGQGGVWAKAAALGRVIDPENALYADQNAATAAAAAVEVVSSSTTVDLDKELMGDFEAPATPSPAAAAVDDIEAALMGMPAPATPVAADLDLEAMLHEPEPAPEVVVEPEPAAASNDSHMLDFDFNLDSMLPAGTAAAEVEPPKPAASTDDALATFDFDLSALDEPAVAAAPLAEPVEAVSTAGLDVSDDPLSTKLDLARVYLDMGDKEGAREVLEELVKEAQGSLKAEAEALLDSL